MDNKKSKSFEEREADYNKTRARIFNENKVIGCMGMCWVFMGMCWGCVWVCVGVCTWVCVRCVPGVFGDKV